MFSFFDAPPCRRGDSLWACLQSHGYNTFVFFFLEPEALLQQLIKSFFESFRLLLIVAQQQSNRSSYGLSHGIGYSSSFFIVNQKQIGLNFTGKRYCLRFSRI